jgi:hypothetical protein
LAAENMTGFADLAGRTDGPVTVVAPSVSNALGMPEADPLRATHAGYPFFTNLKNPRCKIKRNTGYGQKDSSTRIISDL